MFYNSGQHYKFGQNYIGKNNILCWNLWFSNFNAADIWLSRDFRYNCKWHFFRFDCLVSTSLLYVGYMEVIWNLNCFFNFGKYFKKNCTFKLINYYINVPYYFYIADMKWNDRIYNSIFFFFKKIILNPLMPNIHHTIVSSITLIVINMYI
jgi:hypothetical protein